MQKKSQYEILQDDVAKIDEKNKEIWALIKQIEANFLAISFKNEVWLEQEFYEEKQISFKLHCFIGYIPVGNPGIAVKTVVRDATTRELIESKTEMLTSIENGAVLEAASKQIHSLLNEIERTVREHKSKILRINLGSLETLASKDFGREPI